MTKRFLIGLLPLVAAAAFAVAPAAAQAATPSWTINGIPVEEATNVTFTSASTTLAVPEVEAKITCTHDSGTGTIGPEGVDHVNSIDYTSCRGEETAERCTVANITLENASTQLRYNAALAIEDVITLNQAVPIVLSGSACRYAGTNEVTGSVAGTLSGDTLSFSSAPGLTFDGLYAATYTGDEVITSTAGTVGAE